LKVVLSLVAALLVSLTMSEMATNPWATFGGNNQRTSVCAPVHALKGNTMEEKWRFFASSWVSSPAITIDYVIFGTTGREFFCLDRETGNIVWQKRLKGQIHGCPTISGESVYIGDSVGWIGCLDIHTGEEIWSTKTSDGIFSSACVFDDMVCFTSQNGYALCFTKDGDKSWRFKTGNSIYSSATYWNGKVYISSDDRFLYCLEGGTGELIWSREVGSMCWDVSRKGSPTVTEGRIYIGTNDAEMYCLDAETGDEVWFKPMWDKTFSSAVIDDKVYVGSADYSMYCLDKDTGEEIWSFRANSWIVDFPATDGRYVLVPS